MPPDRNRDSCVLETTLVSRGHGRDRLPGAMAETVVNVRCLIDNIAESAYCYTPARGLHRGPLKLGFGRM